ncbi:DUF7311 family protein [Halovenus marina]|uniref:DUF7311 family protein n=1 Tax=Halovenus marina TaxID=3396621 RepID=UPI003F57322A
MLRVVLAVSLAVALFAIAVPAVETARVQYSDQRIASEFETLETVAKTLQERNDPPPAGTSGARTTMILRLPTKGWASADIDRLTVVDTGTVRWRVSGGSEQTRHLSAVDLRPVAGSLQLHDGGRHRLVLQMQPDGSIRVKRADV